ncbi:hypothetical protein B0A81_13670 [Flavobacterium plurextorum]|uniref:RDD family protein n=1 Tax=Flavobacterium plurextorum TaxID=1114867 RepID=A0ABX4CSM2_9FLAO|nr:hypothetical protein [Flavobacterium plurextorum]OXB06359.1 hypothetical protein B0A81_13670 [Flavobacterium plurextorum]
MTESKRSLLKSLFASSIFLIVLKPILEFLWAIIADFSKNTFFNLSDYLYKNAAYGQRNWIDFLVWTAIILGFFLTSILKKNSHKRIDVENINKDNQAKITAKRIIVKYSPIINIILFLPIIYFIMLAYSDLQLNTSFNQRLNIISPYIDSTQEKILKSKWALMKTKEDFERINTKLEEIAKENKIKLPENLLE